jgi:hypothetical protein
MPETNKEARERHQRELEELYEEYGTAVLLTMIVKARKKSREKFLDGGSEALKEVAKKFDQVTDKLEEFAFKGGIVEI